MYVLFYIKGLRWKKIIFLKLFGAMIYTMYNREKHIKEIDF